jgi:hypothetical protein
MEWLISTPISRMLHKSGRKVPFLHVKVKNLALFCTKLQNNDTLEAKNGNS